MNLKKILSYTGIPHKITQVHSTYNNSIIVEEVFGRKSIKVDNLTQSGPILEELWRFALKKISNFKFQISNCLVLGVGGGSVIKVLRKRYPQVKIIGVEIDPVMIALAKKHLNLDGYQASIIIEDAFKFVSFTKEKFDLIIVDILFGRRLPKKFSEMVFHKDIRKILNKNGLVIYNQLKLKNLPADNFADKLTRLYPVIKTEDPLINRLIYCQS